MRRLRSSPANQHYHSLVQVGRSVKGERGRSERRNVFEETYHKIETLFSFLLFSKMDKFMGNKIRIAASMTRAHQFYD